jgi:NADPH2:quinone reductase
MNAQDISMGLQLQSTVKSDNTLELSLAEVAVPEPRESQVLIRVEASPINPSDLGLLFGGADMTTAQYSGTTDRPIVKADIPAAAMASMAARLDQPMPVGNEGSGTVIAAGSDADARALLGKTVAILGGAMYAQYRLIKADQCLVMPEGVSAADCASCFVNPLTSQGMVETMRMEGHKALIHTAAASNLGQMLVKICLQDGVDLVNIVRRPEQAEILKSLGAKYVCNSSLPSFMDDLTDALAETGATIAFDAIGGGELAGQILTAMEIAANRTAAEYSRYGSTVHKQVYIYGGLDRSATILNRAFGMAWGIGGWLLPPFLQKAGPDVANRLRARVAAEIKTTFASTYTQEASLADVLSADAIASYGKQATSEKYLVTPQKV